MDHPGSKAESSRQGFTVSMASILTMFLFSQMLGWA